MPVYLCIIVPTLGLTYDTACLTRELVSGAPNEFFDAVTRLDQQQKSHSHYSDLVIHDYEGYFRALHGADPIETI